MPEQSLTGGDLYCRPTEIDDGAYLRIRQVRPVERAASPIIDHNIELTETALAARPWYRGETRLEPSAYMSIQLDPGKNKAVGLLAEFAETVKAFPPGGKRRVSRSNVFEYYKRELKGIGVKNANDFIRCLHARTQRLSRQTGN